MLKFTTFYLDLDPLVKLKSNKSLINNFSLQYKVIVLGCALISNLEFFYAPPARYPDLFTLINAAYSWALFCVFLIYYHYRQFTFKETLPFTPSKVKLNID